MNKYCIFFLMLALIVGTFLYTNKNSPEYMEGKNGLLPEVESYNESGPVQTINLDAMAVSFENTKDLLSNSELVIVGKPFESENYVTKDSNGFLAQHFTITYVEVTNLVEDKTESKYNIGDIIKVAEPTYFVDDKSTGLIKFTINDYKDMLKEEEYLLVLKEDVQYDDLYVLVGMNEGKYLINPLIENSRDMNNQAHTEKTKIEQFRLELFERYNLN